MGKGCGSELVVVHADGRMAGEVAPHALTTPGSPSIKDEHYPPRAGRRLGRHPRPRALRGAFLAIGPGANAWLIAAARRVRPGAAKMAEAVDLAKLHEPGDVNEACASAAMAAASLTATCGDPRPPQAGAQVIYSPHAPATGVAGSAPRVLEATDDDPLLPRHPLLIDPE